MPLNNYLQIIIFTHLKKYLYYNKMAFWASPAFWILLIGIILIIIGIVVRFVRRDEPVAYWALIGIGIFLIIISIIVFFISETYKEGTKAAGAGLTYLTGKLPDSGQIKKGASNLVNRVSGDEYSLLGLKTAQAQVGQQLQGQQLQGQEQGEGEEGGGNNQLTNLLLLQQLNRREGGEPGQARESGEGEEAEEAEKLEEEEKLEELERERPGAEEIPEESDVHGQLNRAGAGDELSGVEGDLGEFGEVAEDAI